MRQETRTICSAFIAGRTARAKRTQTDGAAMWLHENCIASWGRYDDGSINRNMLEVCFCGWPSTTTKERLNGLFDLLGFGRPFFTSNRQLYFGSKLRPVDDREVMTFDLRVMRELSNDNTPFHHHTIAA